MKSVLTVLSVLILIGPVHPGQGSITRNYIEYNRGMSFPTYSDVRFIYQNHDFTLQNLHLEDESFFPDGSIIPNAFLKHLFNLKFGDAIKSFTEPYYGIRFFHFFKRKPEFGIGIELIHFKVFLVDRKQKSRMTGTYMGSEADRTVNVEDYIYSFNVSHGINHLSLTFVYRLMLSKTPGIKDGRLQPYISVNAGPAIPHMELETNEEGKIDRKAYSYRMGFPNFGIGIGLGVRYKPFKHFGFYAEYKFTYSYLHDMEFDNGENGKVLMDFTDHHLLWGFSIIL